MLAYRLTWQAVACADRYNIMVNGRQYAQTTGTEYLLASDGTAWADGGVITDEDMATKTPGLFCAGDIRSKHLRQVITAASDGAIAGMSAYRYIAHH